VDTTSLSQKSIHEILTPLCELVHPAWVGEHTTAIATSMAVLRLADGDLPLLAPCEVEQPEAYPSLGLSLKRCDSEALQWVRNGKTHSMKPLAEAAELLPFPVAHTEESDPLGEGPVSEIVLVGPDGSRLVFRHIMPPMTLGIELLQPGQATNNSFKRMPLRGTP
jgi:hypothetical protein